MKNAVYAVLCVCERELTVLGQASDIKKAEEILLEDFAQTVEMTADEVLRWEDGQPDDNCCYECEYQSHTAWANNVHHANYDWHIIEVAFSD